MRGAESAPAPTRDSREEGGRAGEFKACANDECCSQAEDVAIDASFTTSVGANRLASNEEPSPPAMVVRLAVADEVEEAEEEAIGVVTDTCLVAVEGDSAGLRAGLFGPLLADRVIPDIEN
jgi:hypothetical protein